MAENNITINIAAQASQSEMVDRVAEAFVTASGLIGAGGSDGNHVIPLGNNLAIKVAAEGSNMASIYAVSPDGTASRIQAISYYSQAATFIYNYSASKKVFAFGLYQATTSNKPLAAAIAADTGGNTRILCFNSSYLRIFDGNQQSYCDVDMPNPVNALFTLVTMTKLGAYFARETYDELYLLNAAPSFTMNATDMSIYSGGNLYKLIQGGVGALCMKV